MRQWLKLSLAALVLFITKPVQADPHDPAGAQALFDQARALMAAQHFAEACARFEESQRLDPGMGTQFHLAQCYEAEGKIASAWALFLEVASQAAAAGQGERESLSRARAGRLEGRLAKLSIVVPPAARTAGLRVTRAGVEVGEVQWGLPLPLDPGEYMVRASAPGYLEYTTKVTAVEASTASVTIPVLEAAPAVQPKVAPVKPVAANPPPPAASRHGAAPIDAEGPRLTRSQRIASASLGALSLVALGTAAALGVIAGHKNDDSKRYCPVQPTACTDRGVELRNQAFTFANVSTALFVTGGVAAAGALVVWLVGRKRNTRGQGMRRLDVDAWADPAGSQLRVKGKF